jgi:hypothetical protein
MIQPSARRAFLAHAAALVAGARMTFAARSKLRLGGPIFVKSADPVELARWVTVRNTKKASNTS